MAERDPAFLCRHRACKDLPACQYVLAGPHPVPKPLPSMDPHAYPVHCGPHTTGPQEAEVPEFYRADGSWPAPYDPAVMARPAPETAVAYPAPTVTSEDGLPGLVKLAVVNMELTARGSGWNTRTTYAKGHVPHARLGTPSATPRESLAVRMWRGEQRAVAVYVATAGGAWSWTTLYLWRLGEFPTKYATVTPFLDALTMGVPA